MGNRKGIVDTYKGTTIPFYFFVKPLYFFLRCVMLESGLNLKLIFACKKGNCYEETD